MLLRLEREIQPFAAERFLELGELRLRQLGVTRQKSAYLLDLSQSLVSGRINLRGLSRLSDDQVLVRLTGIKGIGLWSANIYLLMAMRRADIWPAGDLALAVAIKELKGLREKPSPEELEAIAEQWRPHRAVAARMLWQYYLGRKSLYSVVYFAIVQAVVVGIGAGIGPASGTFSIVDVIRSSTTAFRSLVSRYT